jgi:hypothetical protein
MGDESEEALEQVLLLAESSSEQGLWDALDYG